jgi:hypothetical protein
MTVKHWDNKDHLKGLLFCGFAAAGADVVGRIGGKRHKAMR